MKKSCFMLLALLFQLALTTQMNAQMVAKKVIVEHFTNSRCGVCASKNPSLFTNLTSHPDILHISYHPSSPYSSCVFSQSNPAENDSRTNFYGIFGGTPRIVIQGDVISSSTNFGSSTLFTAYEDQFFSDTNRSD